ARCVSAALSDGWYFMRMPIILKKWIRSCKTCQLAKVGGRNPVQPYLYRRGAVRFQEVQLDFLGPLTDSTDSPEPNDCNYLVILVDSATQICMGFISALLQWIAIFGLPLRLQLDSPPSHTSESLLGFLSVLGIDRSLGIARRRRVVAQSHKVAWRIPSELAFGLDDPFLPSKSMLDGTYTLQVSADSWSNLRNQ
ncbi:hypothetical protein FOL47_004514, partial [Perkinsus chesapeaki]